MSNITVYPFGTGGDLPSDVGIINDLVTGGANKALSAQQGVVLKGMIDEAAGKTGIVEVDMIIEMYASISGNYINKTNNVWSFNRKWF